MHVCENETKHQEVSRVSVNGVSLRFLSFREEILLLEKQHILCRTTSPKTSLIYDQRKGAIVNPKP